MAVNRVVNESSVAGKNKAQLTISSTGTRGQNSLVNFSRQLKYHHFKVKKASPGKVYVKEYSHSTSRHVQKRRDYYITSREETSGDTHAATSAFLLLGTTLTVVSTLDVVCLGLACSNS